jgi:hypothetical protein
MLGSVMYIFIPILLIITQSGLHLTAKDAGKDNYLPRRNRDTVGE